MNLKQLSELPSDQLTIFDPFKNSNHLFSFTDRITFAYLNLAGKKVSNTVTRATACIFFPELAYGHPVPKNNYKLGSGQPPKPYELSKGRMWLSVDPENKAIVERLGEKPIGEYLNKCLKSLTT